MVFRQYAALCKPVMLSYVICTPFCQKTPPPFLDDLHIFLINNDLVVPLFCVSLWLCESFLTVLPLL
jgi:hypothetical protein